MGYFASINFFEQQTSSFFRTIDRGGLLDRYPRSAKAASVVLSGFLAGVFGACINTPGDTIRSTIQKQVLSQINSNSAVTSTSFLAAGSQIIASKGLTGLYAGFKFKAFHLGGGDHQLLICMYAIRVIMIVLLHVCRWCANGVPDPILPDIIQEDLTR